MREILFRGKPLGDLHGKFIYGSSGMDYTVRRGDKISQLVVVKIDTPELVLVDKLADTERGNGGFGSTGR